jgi:hypothetical protein
MDISSPPWRVKGILHLKKNGRDLTPTYKSKILHILEEGA